MKPATGSQPRIATASQYLQLGSEAAMKSLYCEAELPGLGWNRIECRGNTAVLQYEKCRKAINRFLNTDRIGAIGHISCIDRRSRASAASGGNDKLNDFAAVSAGQMEGICGLLGKQPSSVNARSTYNDRTMCLQVFLRINEHIGVQYFATIDDGPSEHELWIEGANGSLRTNGSSVWWRKRGWHIFVPIRIGLLGVPAETASQLAAHEELTNAIVRSAGGEGTVQMAAGR